MMASRTAGAMRAYGRFFGAILGAAASGKSTAEVWAAIRQEAELQGLSSPGVSAADVSTLRGYAGQYLRAQQAFNSANPDLAITDSMIGNAWYARPADLQAAAPKYRVTYVVTGTDLNGDVTYAYQSSVIGPEGLTTVGQMQQSVTQDVLDRIAASQYEVGDSSANLASVASVTDVTILRI